MAERDLDDLGLAQLVLPQLQGNATERDRHVAIESWRRSIRRWRSGDNLPRLHQAKIVAEALKVSVDDLLEGGS